MEGFSVHRLNQPVVYEEIKSTDLDHKHWLTLNIYRFENRQ